MPLRAAPLWADRGDRRATSDEDNKVVVRRLADAVNSGKLATVDAVLATDYVRHDPSDLLREAGVQQHKPAFARIRRAFPIVHWTIEELLFFKLKPSQEPKQLPYINRIDWALTLFRLANPILCRGE